MPDDDPNALEHYLKFLYGTSYWFESSEAFGRDVEVVLLARKYCCEGLEEQATAAAHTNLDYWLDAEEILSAEDMAAVKRIYSILDAGDVLRRMVVDNLGGCMQTILEDFGDELSEVLQECPGLSLELLQYQANLVKESSKRGSASLRCTT